VKPKKEAKAKSSAEAKIAAKGVSWEPSEKPREL